MTFEVILNEKLRLQYVEIFKKVIKERRLKNIPQKKMILKF